MLLYREALAKLMDAAVERGRRPFQTVPLKDSVGRITSGAILAGEDLPAFDNSAMDGFAVRSGIKEARVTASIAAGDAPVEASGAVEIMTGAPIPAGCDSVIKLEDVQRAGDTIKLSYAPEKGDWVRPKGSDFAKGQQIMAAGRRIEPRHLLGLAALGYARVPVRLRPRVALISTGKELVDCGQKPAPGQIRNATLPYLTAELERLGCQLLSTSIVGDEAASFRERLEPLLDDDLDLIITTGGVSMGRHDFVPEVLAELGAETLFHKTAVKPGKPVLAARLGHGPLFLGLPGNPVSTAAGLRFFAVPVFRFLLGQEPEAPVMAALEGTPEKPEKLRCFFKGVVSQGRARCLEGQSSHQIRPLLEADSWVVLPEGPVAAGTQVETYPL